MKKQLLTLAILSTIFTGCATLTQDSVQPLTFTSMPEGALVYIDGALKGKTPVTIQVEKGEAKQLEFKKDGYSTVTQPLSKNVSGWFFGNILIGGLLGSTTDAASGNMYEYTPNNYNVELKKK